MINNLDDKRKNTIWEEVQKEMDQLEIGENEKTIDMCALEWGVTRDVAKYKLAKLVKEGKLKTRVGRQNTKIYIPAE